MGASGAVLYFRVVLPAGLPSLITGLKQGWSFAWRALMAAEVMSASIGLGQTLMMGRDLADINRVMLVIIIIILIGVVIEKFVFSTVEERVLKRIGL
jgi:NitT/TauT family transport system permease protein